MASTNLENNPRTRLSAGLSVYSVPLFTAISAHIAGLTPQTSCPESFVTQLRLRPHLIPYLICRIYCIYGTSMDISGQAFLEPYIQWQVFVLAPSGGIIPLQSM